MVTIYTEWTPPRELDLLETEATKEALVKCFTSLGQWLKKRQYAGEDGNAGDWDWKILANAIKVMIRWIH